MINCISVENMRQSDAYTIAAFVPGKVLMYRAAMGIFLASTWEGNTAILVGSGNNGGDGYALACILKEKGFRCRIFTVSEPKTPDSLYYAQMAENAGISISPYECGCLKGFDILVDCLLGTGFRGEVRGKYRTVIGEINASGAFVVCADINSGMNGDSGEASLAVQSDLTVTIGYVKTGLVAPNAGKYMKRLVCADIGIVLLKEEEKITSESAPHWLDLQIIDARI